MFGKGLDFTQFREVTLLIRVHSGYAFSGTSTFTITVFIEAPTVEDQSDFVGPQVGSQVLSATTLPAAGTPVLFAVPLLNPATGSAPNLGSFLRVIGNWAPAAGASASLVISIELVGKS